MAALTAAACGSSPSSPASPFVNTIAKPTDIFTTLGIAGLGCPHKPTQLGAGAAKVALCSPIAGIRSAFLTIGMYPTAAVAAQEYHKNCRYGGWSLFRQGQNWRGAMGPRGTIPESVAKKIAIALHTDLRHACPASSAPSPTPTG